jgi:NAD(P)-dependent dehydrogenase (short-subunit alcohol dehydrogenase family)
MRRQPKGYPDTTSKEGAPVTAEHNERAFEPGLEGRVAVVTGAASGIGLATALRFLACGASVVGVDLAFDEADLPLREGERVALVAADVTNDADVERAIGVVRERYGGLDVLANVAGVLGANPTVAEVDADALARTFAVNVAGPTLMLKHAVSLLRERRGVVVNVTSMLAQRPSASAAYYAASKAALQQLSRCWALELGPDGIRVNTVAPGPTDTPVLKRAGLSEERIAQVRRAAADRTPLGRRAQPEDIARWIVRLADPDSFATGQSIIVDGGHGLT